VIVCHCRVVTDRAITDAVDSGAGSLAGLCRSTGAAQDCGACVFSVKRLMCEHGLARSTTPVLAAPRPAVAEVDLAAG
jgi:bacterioferritin-associated ferredoxin